MTQGETPPIIRVLTLDTIGLGVPRRDGAFKGRRSPDVPPRRRKRGPGPGLEGAVRDPRRRDRSDQPRGEGGGRPEEGG